MPDETQGDDWPNGGGGGAGDAAAALAAAQAAQADVDAHEAAVGAAVHGLGAAATQPYAAGTWTPRLINATDLAFCNFGTGAGAVGQYVRVGALVSCRFSIVLGTAPNMGTSTGPLYLVGPPVAGGALTAEAVVGTIQAWDGGAGEVRSVNLATQAGFNWIDLALLGLPAEEVVLFSGYSEGIGSASYGWSPGNPVTVDAASDSMYGFFNYQAAS